MSVSKKKYEALFLLLIAASIVSSQQVISEKDKLVDSVKKQQSTLRIEKRANRPKTTGSFRKLIKEAEQTDSTNLIASIYVDYSIFMTNQNELDTAVKYAFLAQEINYIVNDDLLEARILHTLGWYYHNIGDYEHAIGKYNESLVLYKKISYPRGIENTLRKLSIAYGKLGNHQKALSVHEQIAILDDCQKCAPDISFRLYNTHRVGDSARTLKYIDQYFGAIHNEKDHINHNSTWHEIKAIQAGYDADITLELHHLQQARKILERKNKPKAICAIYDHIGDYFLRQDDPVKALEFYDKSHQIISINGFSAIFTGNIDRLIAVAGRLNNEVLKAKYQGEQKKFDNQLSAKKSLGRLIEQTHQLKLREKDYEIELLKTTRKQQSRFLVLLSTFSLVTLLLLFLVLFYYQKYRRQSRNLAEKNRALDLSVNEKQTLLQETHHRVKNNLQIIASLLNLQRKYTKDKKLTSALIDGRNRVKSMALIHQLLYQNKVIRGINVRTYTDNLISSLMGSFKLDNENITFINEVEPLELHEDTLLSIGLIINELVTNAFKYAFLDSDEGIIIVALKMKGEILELSVSDNGVGLPKDFDMQNTSSFGYNLINSLSKKLVAKIIVDQSEGTSITLLITKFKLA